MRARPSWSRYQLASNFQVCSSTMLSSTLLLIDYFGYHSNNIRPVFSGSFFDKSSSFQVLLVIPLVCYLQVSKLERMKMKVNQRTNF